MKDNPLLAELLISQQQTKKICRVDRRNGMRGIFQGPNPLIPNRLASAYSNQHQPLTYEVRRIGVGKEGLRGSKVAQS